MKFKVYRERRLPPSRDLPMRISCSVMVAWPSGTYGHEEIELPLDLAEDEMLRDIRKEINARWKKRQKERVSLPAKNERQKEYKRLDMTEDTTE